MDLGNIFQRLYNTALTLIEQATILWNWLQESHFFGLEIFGVDLGFTITPLELLGGAIITLVIGWIIKSIIPGA